jgi:hypothetical protein
MTHWYAIINAENMQSTSPSQCSFLRNRQFFGCVRFQVLTVVSMKIRVFWDVAPYIHVEVDRHFRGVYCLPDDGGSMHL